MILARLAKLCFSMSVLRLLIGSGAVDTVFDCCLLKIQILTVVSVQQMIVRANKMLVWLFLFTGKLQTGLGWMAEQMYQMMWFLPGRAINATCGYKQLQAYCKFWDAWKNMICAHCMCWILESTSHNPYLSVIGVWVREVSFKNWCLTDSGS